MQFNSVPFVLFFPLVAGTYFVLPQRFRWLWLLVASCAFYMAFIPVYILILAGTIVVDYAAGILVEDASGGARKRWLALSIVANVGVLAVFKYYNFLADIIAPVLPSFAAPGSLPHLTLLLPIGLSFHTFQAMSYTIEVYRGRQRAERHFGMYALYVMFFPQLVAGPIERPQQLLPQFRVRHAIDASRIASGLRRIVGGLIKKVVIADRLAIYVNEVYAHPRGFSGAPLVIGTVFFTFQIYCDFAGYSDIAIGTARVLGFELVENFRAPYFSRSTREFWTRWHISLSSWFRDYLIMPLGGRSKGLPRWCFNLMLTFLISGLWHGANWTFVAWGALNGTYVVVGHLTANSRRRFTTAGPFAATPQLIHVGQVLTTFSLISASFVLFRATTFGDAAYVATHIRTGAGNHAAILHDFGRINMAISVALIVGLLVVEFGSRHVSLLTRLARLPGAVRWSVDYAACLLIAAFGVFGGQQHFIYFQF